MAEEKVVTFRVFLDDSDRTRFKVACAEEKTTMSQKSKELILEWMQKRHKEQNKD
jgi:hypothetical protein